MSRSNDILETTTEVEIETMAELDGETEGLEAKLELMLGFGQELVSRMTHQEWLTWQTRRENH